MTKPIAGSLALEIVYRLVPSLIPNPRNARTHSRKQIRQIIASIRKFGFVNPIIVDATGMVLAGHGRLEAAKALGMKEVPTVEIGHLTEAERRAYVLADNKIAENAGWDREMLEIELGELAILLPLQELSLEDTGFELGEIDQILTDHAEHKPDPIDHVPTAIGPAVTRLGDCWILGHHRIICGDSRSIDVIRRLLAGARAQMFFADPPYNVPVAGHVQGRGEVKHREFLLASGEMSPEAFRAFLSESLKALASVAIDGAIAFVCMDWRHVEDLIVAGRGVFAELKNIVVWTKSSAGQGSFYRSQHEFILVFKVGTGPHINSFGLGQYGRSRSNVWTYPGANSFRKGRAEELAMHPTVKPVALVADAMRDCSVKHSIVLDGFLGSGTTLMAAEKVGRRCYGVEIDPIYVDTAIKRWQTYTKLEAILEGDGRTWDEVRAERLGNASSIEGGPA